MLDMFVISFVSSFRSALNVPSRGWVGLDGNDEKRDKQFKNQKNYWSNDLSIDVVSTLPRDTFF